MAKAKPAAPVASPPKPAPPAEWRIATLVFWLLLSLCYMPQVADSALAPRAVLIAVAVLGASLAMPKMALAKALQAPPVWAWGGLLAGGLLSFFVTPVPAESIYVWMRWATLGVGLTVLLAGFATGKLRPEQWGLGIATFMGVQALVMAIQAARALEAKASLLAEPQMLSGLMANKNLLAFGWMLLPPWLVLLARRPERWARPLAGILAVGAALVPLVLQSRGVLSGYALGALAAAALVLPGQTGRLRLGKKGWALVGAMVLGLGLFTAAALTGPRLVRLLDSKSISERALLNSSSLKIIADHPLTGTGLGTWPLEYPRYGLGPYEWKVQLGVRQITRAHNDYLQLWAEAGPLALAAMLALLGLSLYYAFRLRRQDAGLAAAAILTLVSYTWVSALDFPLERPELSLMLLSLTALLWHRSRGLGEQAPSPTRPPAQGGWPPAGLAAVAAVCLLGRLSAERSLYAAQKAMARGQAERMLAATDHATANWLALDPYGLPPSLHVGRMLAAQGQLQQAWPYIEQAVAVAPYNVLVLNIAAQLSGQLGRVNEAIAFAQRSLAVSVRQPRAQVVIATLAHLSGQDSVAYRYMRFVSDTSINTLFVQYRQPIAARELARQANHLPASPRRDSLLSLAARPEAAYAYHLAAKAAKRGLVE